MALDRRIAVFAGPSLPSPFRPLDPIFEWHPPASAGDLLSLAENAPETLCLIDGYFDSCPAPWHKELLLLMAAGTTVYGASSMGALRAAELDAFGMIGIGAIFEAYSAGRLVGDDEVALIHAPERLDWAPLSVPMVELRATLIDACRRRVVGPPTARLIRDLAHDVHYSDRDWPLLERHCQEVTDAETFPRIRALHVPLKRLDAIACLAAARREPHQRPPTVRPPLTCFIRELVDECADQAEAPRRRSISTAQ